MERFLDVLRALALIAAAVALTVAAGLEVSLYRQRANLSAILASVKSGSAHFDSASQSLDIAAKSSDAESRELKKSIADLHDLLAHTDISLNRPPGLLPTLTKAVNDQDAALVSLETQATFTIERLDDAASQADATLATINVTAGDLQALAADPDIKDTLAHLDASAATASETIANLDAIAASGNRDAQMLEARLKQALKPVSMLRSVLEHLLGIAPAAVEVGVTLAK